MEQEDYYNRVREFVAYLGLQAKIIEVYDPAYNNLAMLEEVGPLATKAVSTIFFKKKRLKSLEEMIQNLGQRISNFEKANPDTASSEEVVGFKDLLDEKKRDLYS